MKLIKWIGHPVIMVILYLLLIIEGDNFGGFYMLYLMLSVPHGVPYATVAALGIAGVVVAFNIHSARHRLFKPVLYLLGFGLMIFSLILFFQTGYNWKTFQLIVPCSSFILFGICAACFLIRTMDSFLPKKERAVRQLKTTS